MSNYAPFCNKQVNYIKNTLEPNNFLNVLEGGKRAGKNIINIIAWCAILEDHPDKLHLAAGVSVATAKLNIIDSDGFGVANYFAGRCRQGKYQDKDALIIQTRVGEKVVLIAGGGKAGDERYVKGLTLGSVYVSESNECAQAFIKEIFDRTMSSSCRKILFDLNPKSELHWFYTEILNVHEKNALEFPDYGYNYQHMTLFDNMSMSDEQIKQLLRTYDKTSVWFLRDILGKRKNVEGLVYDCFCDKNKYSDGEGPNYDLYYRRYYSADYGTINPFGCLEIIEQTIERVTNYYIENEYYYNSKKEKRQKDDYEYCDDVIKFIDDKQYKSIIIDPSAASFKLALRKKLLRPMETADVINADNEVLNGIRLVSTLFQAGKLHVNKDKCPNLIQELGSYIWDEKASLRGVEKVIKENDHECDALRYFCKTIVKAYKI